MVTTTISTDAERLAEAVAKGMKDSRIAAAKAGEDMEFLRHQIATLRAERDAAEEARLRAVRVCKEQIQRAAREQFRADAAEKERDAARAALQPYLDAKNQWEAFEAAGAPAGCVGGHAYCCDQAGSEDRAKVEGK